MIKKRENIFFPIPLLLFPKTKINKVIFKKKVIKRIIYKRLSKRLLIGKIKIKVSKKIGKE